MGKVAQERWRPHVEAAAKAGVTLAQYAREHGLSRHTLYAARQAMAGIKNPKPVKKEGESGSKSFIPVRISTSMMTPIPMTVRLPNGLELSFGAVGSEDLRALVPLLATLSCSV